MNWPLAIFFLFAIGACVGSFINVVIFRVPEDQSLVWPPSHCPKCKHQLTWWENVPIFSWFYLGGQCRSCKSKIHIQYPIIEAIGAVIFVGLFVIYYSPDLAAKLGHPYATGFASTWPIYLVHVVLLSSLLAATWIDFKHYIIPLEIPWLATVTSLIGLAVYAWLNPVAVPTETHLVVPVVGQAGVNMAIGGVAGLIVALLLLRWKVLPRSFDDEEMHALEEQSMIAEAQAGEPTEQVQPAEPAESHDDGEEAAPDEPAQQERDDDAPNASPIDIVLTYSHPRREVLKEAAFLLFPILAAAAAIAFDIYPPGPEYPPIVKVVAGVVCGYLVGGGMVWITRVLGTLGFGKEAMGLGDVHLLGAIGAALGPKAVCLIFFIAPFLGLTYVVLAVGISRALRGKTKVIPYGPYLALATVIVMIAPKPIWDLLKSVIWSGTV